MDEREEILNKIQEIQDFYVAGNSGLFMSLEISKLRKRLVALEEQQDGMLINEDDKMESMKKASKSTEDESNNGQPASEERKFNESLLECTVCLEVPSSNPIYQCRNGHLYCKECHPKLQECSVCQEGKDQLGKIICLLAQKLLEKE